MDKPKKKKKMQEPVDISIDYIPPPKEQKNIRDVMDNLFKRHMHNTFVHPGPVENVAIDWEEMGIDLEKKKEMEKESKGKFVLKNKKNGYYYSEKKEEHSIKKYARLFDTINQALLWRDTFPNSEEIEVDIL